MNAERALQKDSAISAWQDVNLNTRDPFRDYLTRRCLALKLLLTGLVCRNINLAFRSGAQAIGRT